MYVQVVMANPYSPRGRMENQTTTITNVFVWIRKEDLPGVGLIVIVTCRDNSSV